MGFPSGRYLPSASLPLRAALRGSGLVLLRADLFASPSLYYCSPRFVEDMQRSVVYQEPLKLERGHDGTFLLDTWMETNEGCHRSGSK